MLLPICEVRNAPAFFRCFASTNSIVRFFEYSTWMYLLSNFLSPDWQISIDHYLRTRAKNKKESKYSLYIMMSRHTVPSGKNWIVIIPPPQLAQGSVSVIHPPISSYPRDFMHPSRRVYVFACQVLSCRSRSATNQSKFQYARLGSYHNPNTDDITAS